MFVFGIAVAVASFSNLDRIFKTMDIVSRWQMDRTILRVNVLHMLQRHRLDVIIKAYSIFAMLCMLCYTMDSLLLNLL